MSSFKRIIKIILLVVLLGAAFFTWRIFGSNTFFEEKKKAFYIKTGSDFYDVERELGNEKIIDNTRSFRLMAKLTGYIDHVKPGKYVFEKGSSIYSVLKTLKAGKQTPVNFTITKLRTNQDLATKLSNSFESDPVAVAALFSNNDSLKQYDLDTNTAITIIIPNTYTFYWNTPIAKVIRRLQDEQKKFWNQERQSKATALGLNYRQVYTLASIVEEETNKDADKGKIASVYLNRIQKGMNLGADPTVKFALKDFGLKRIYQKHLQVESPYNTYRNAGLPPGPICTPSIKTIDAVLNAPATSYLYFVAKPELDGYSNFATTYDEHLKYAKAYQRALDTLYLKRTAGK